LPTLSDKSSPLLSLSENSVGLTLSAKQDGRHSQSIGRQQIGKNMTNYGLSASTNISPGSFDVYVEPTTILSQDLSEFPVKTLKIQEPLFFSLPPPQFSSWSEHEELCFFNFTYFRLICVFF
jgi:hypothetical protein